MMNAWARLQLAAAGFLSLVLLASGPSEEETPSKKHATGDANKKTQVAKPKAKKPSSSAGSTTAVPKPVLSKDECQNNGDCVPAEPCHARTCTSAPRKMGDIPCTMECRGGTVDCGYNHCACVKGPSGNKVCALVSGPGAGR